MSHPLIRPTRRQTRGLVRRIRKRIAESRAETPDWFARQWEEAPPFTWAGGRNCRDLVGSIVSKSSGAGTCIWCDDPTGSARRWHDECVRACAAARGVGTPLNPPLLKVKDPVFSWSNMQYVPPITCEACGKINPSAPEIDHRIALGVAARVWTPWTVVKAWSLSNLQWLCHGCHVAKTRQDRLAMKSLDRGYVLKPGRKQLLSRP